MARQVANEGVFAGLIKGHLRGPGAQGRDCNLGWQLIVDCLGAETVALVQVFGADDPFMLDRVIVLQD